jgi:hypothetical protein
MPERYVARFRHAPGRYLVERDGTGFTGRRIHDRRQLTKHGNPPDPETGLWLNEMSGWYLASDLISLKPFTPDPSERRRG